MVGDSDVISSLDGVLDAARFGLVG